MNNSFPFSMKKQKLHHIGDVMKSCSGEIELLCHKDGDVGDVDKCDVNFELMNKCSDSWDFKVIAYHVLLAAAQLVFVFVICSKAFLHVSDADDVKRYDVWKQFVGHTMLGSGFVTYGVVQMVYFYKRPWYENHMSRGKITLAGVLVHNVVDRMTHYDLPWSEVWTVHWALSTIQLFSGVWDIVTAKRRDVKNKNIATFFTAMPWALIPIMHHQHNMFMDFAHTSGSLFICIFALGNMFRENTAIPGAAFIIAGYMFFMSQVGIAGLASDENWEYFNYVALCLIAPLSVNTAYYVLLC